MSNAYVNKVILNGETEPLIDISTDTVAADKVLTGYTFHHKSGETMTGTCDYDSATTDATADEDEILYGETAYANKTKVTGKMPNNGSVTKVITAASETYTIPQGYHDGGGKVSLDSTNLTAANIKSGVTILGVIGTMTGAESVSVQASKTVTPDFDGFTVTPDSGYDYLGQVVVSGITMTRTANGSTGGDIVTIG